MTIGIIGFGKFAKFIVEVIQNQNFEIKFKIFSKSNPIDNIQFFEISEISSCDIVIPCVPIKAFEETIKQISPLLSATALVTDVCSVKVHPKEIMLKFLPQTVQIIATHPMFGPESYKKMNNSVKGFNLVIENVRCEDNTYVKLIKFLKDLELKVIEMTCEEHDRMAAVFHFTTMFTGLMVKATGIQRTSIDTFSAQKMHDFMDMVGEDTEILHDMYNFNPFCREQLEKLTLGFNNLKASIINWIY